MQDIITILADATHRLALGGIRSCNRLEETFSGTLRLHDVSRRESCMDSSMDTIREMFPPLEPDFDLEKK